jgi:hypothetical protein
VLRRGTAPARNPDREPIATFENSAPERVAVHSTAVTAQRMATALPRASSLDLSTSSLPSMRAIDVGVEPVGELGSQVVVHVAVAQVMQRTGPTGVEVESCTMTLPVVERRDAVVAGARRATGMGPARKVLSCRQPARAVRILGIVPEAQVRTGSTVAHGSLRALRDHCRCAKRQQQRCEHSGHATPIRQFHEFPLVSKFSAPDFLQPYGLPQRKESHGCSFRRFLDVTAGANGGVRGERPSFRAVAQVDSQGGAELSDPLQRIHPPGRSRDRSRSQPGVLADRLHPVDPPLIRERFGGGSSQGRPPPARTRRTADSARRSTRSPRRPRSGSTPKNRPSSGEGTGSSRTACPGSQTSPTTKTDPRSAPPTAPHHDQPAQPRHHNPTPQRRPHHRRRHPPPRPATRTTTTNDQELLNPSTRLCRGPGTVGTSHAFANTIIQVKGHFSYFGLPAQDRLDNSGSGQRFYPFGAFGVRH